MTNPSDRNDLTGLPSDPDPIGGHEAPVLVFKAASNEEAEVVLATLQAAGIDAALQSDPINPVLGALDPPSRDTAGMGVYVKPSQVEAARAILTAPPPSEEELAAEAESDPRSLEQAEAEIKRA